MHVTRSKSSQWWLVVVSLRETRCDACEGMIQVILLYEGISPLFILRENFRVASGALIIFPQWEGGKLKGTRA